MLTRNCTQRIIAGAALIMTAEHLRGKTINLPELEAMSEAQTQDRLARDGA